MQERLVVQEYEIHRLFAEVEKGGLDRQAQVQGEINEGIILQLNAKVPYCHYHDILFEGKTQ
jgi:hypothetical protein